MDTITTTAYIEEEDDADSEKRFPGPGTLIRKTKTSSAYVKLLFRCDNNNSSIEEEAEEATKEEESNRMHEVAPRREVKVKRA